MNIDQLATKGYTIIENVFSPAEISAILVEIETADRSTEGFRVTKDLFAIRRFLQTIPSCHPLIFAERFRALIKDTLGPDYFVVKSIYFDKPLASNWFVAWHQDLTISVDRKVDMEGYGCWTVKQGQFSVQPPLAILENIYTIRIHLDDTNEQNGALRVIPGSHRKGIILTGSAGRAADQEVNCPVGRGGVMIMRPLLMHASQRTTNHQPRRVIHIEFSNLALPALLHWSEKTPICQGR